MSARHARWVWLPGAPEHLDVHALLRHRFVVGEPSAAMLRITADGRYIVWLNGVRIGRGPVRSEPRNLTFDAYEVALRAGENVIAVHARRYGRPTLYWKPSVSSRGGVLADVRVGSEVLAATAVSWRAMRAPYRPLDPPPAEGAPDPEALDGRAFPHGWQHPHFDDGAWPLAVAVAGDRPSFEVLGARPIAHLVEREISAGDLHVRAGEPAIVDLGYITNAHVGLGVDAPPGAHVVVRCGEEIAGDEVLLDVREWSLEYTAAGVGGEEVEAFEPVGFRYLRVEASEDARVRVRARERTYPRAPGASFRCSDPALNAIWEAGARTLDLCSTDAFIDCPSREQRAWLGDDYVNTLVSLVLNPDRSLPLWDLRLHAAGQRADGILPMVAAGDFTDRAHTIPDYSLLWIGTLARLYEDTGDATLVAELLPVAHRILDAFEAMRASGGLLAGFKPGLEGWVFVDWAQTERGDHIAAVDAMYAFALTEAASLAEVAGQDAIGLRARAARTLEALETCWDEDRGVYVDAAWADGTVGRRVSQQTNGMAILAGAPESRWPRILARITDDERLVRTLTPGDGGTFGERLNRQWERPPNFDDERNVVLAQPFFAHFLHQAFVHAGRRDLLLPSIRRWQAMVERSGTVEEYWDALPGMGSRCHAWSATPTYDLVAHVLGVRPGAPGWSSAVVEPHLGDLAWAEGSVPTPRGFIHVRAEPHRAPTIAAPPNLEVRRSQL